MFLGGGGHQLAQWRLREKFIDRQRFLLVYLGERSPTGWPHTTDPQRLLWDKCLAVRKRHNFTKCMLACTDSMVAWQLLDMQLVSPQRVAA
jgi:hypothetical protein